MNNETKIINSVFYVKPYKKDGETIEVEGYGQNTVRKVRTSYPRFTRVVLKGFTMDGTFVKLRL